MTPSADDARNIALALDAFMAEHQRCWRLYGEGLESVEDGAVLWIECGGCEAVLRVTKG